MRATYVSPLRTRYRRSGGPWDPSSVGTLDRLFADDGGARVAAVAGGLRALGVGRGDVVAWQLPNDEAAVVLFRACWRLGAVAAPVHHLATSAEVDRLLDRLGPAYLHEAGAPLPRGAAVHRGDPAARAQPADVAAVLHTTGSSGAPKAVLHTHRGLAYKARLMVDVHGLTAGDAVLMPAPLAHISGLLNGVLVPGAARMRVRLMTRWDPDEALGLIEDERISFMVGPPTFFGGLLGASTFRPSRVASLRLVSCGGAGVTPAFVTDAAERLDAVVKRTYGSTEAPTVTTWQPGDPVERRASTDGRPIGEVELRVEPATGELLVRGPELFAGYADPNLNAGAFAPGGWFRTGDRATVDGEAWLTITGRLGELIIRGGENIAPAEVEAVVEAHPAVRSAVVVGAPDERMGERVAAAVTVVAGATFDAGECRRWCAERGLARFKMPERVVVLDTIPTLAAGKPDRAAIGRLLATQR